MKKYFLTAGVWIFSASAWSMWRENCVGGCRFDQVVFGWPVFFRTPYSPDDGVSPEFFLVPLLLNIIWTAAAAVIVWAVADTRSRWRDRQQPPETPGL